MTNTLKQVALNKTRLLLLFFISLAFIAVGTLIVIFAETLTKSHPTVVRIVGISIAVFFTPGVLVTGWRYFDSRPGLRFDSAGFYDYSGFTAAGRIEWVEVSGLRVRTLDTEKFIYVMMNDPSRLLKTGPVWIRWFRTANLKMFGSPVQISSNSLKVCFDDLVRTFEYYVGKSADAA